MFILHAIYDLSSCFEVVVRKDRNHESCTRGRTENLQNRRRVSFSEPETSSLSLLGLKLGLS